jgi:hypothetical protein
MPEITFSKKDYAVHRWKHDAVVGTWHHNNTFNLAKSPRSKIIRSALNVSFTMMKQLIVTILFILPIVCIGEKCGDLPKEFGSFTDALSHFLSTQFVFEDGRSETLQSLSEKKNAKLVSAHYYSCDKNTGYAEFLFYPATHLYTEKFQ